MKKWAIITGASSGFGLLTTIELAKQGFNVLATMRNIKKATIFQTITTDKELLHKIHPFSVDVTKQDSIIELKNKVASLETVDVLVNNAGFAMGGFAEQVEIDAYRKQFETNVFGVMAITQAILPIMRSQGKGKIINVSSISGQIAFPGLSPYVASKHALEGYSESLQLEVKPFGIEVALVEPGSYQTNIWSSGMEVTKEAYAESSPYYNYMEAITKELEVGKSKHGNPNEVAKLIGRIARKERLNKLRYPIGKGVKSMMVLRRLIPWMWWERLVLSKIKGKKK